MSRSLIIDAVGRRYNQVRSEQRPTALEVVILFGVPHIQAHMPRHHRVVDRDPIEDERFDGRRYFAAILDTRSPSAAPPTAPLATHGGGWKEGLIESRFAYEGGLRSGVVELFPAIHRLPVEGTSGRRGVTEKFVILVGAIFY